jgi:hypothetical protein
MGSSTFFISINNIKRLSNHTGSAMDRFLIVIRLVRVLAAVAAKSIYEEI